MRIPIEVLFEHYLIQANRFYASPASTKLGQFLRSLVAAGKPEPMDDGVLLLLGLMILAAIALLRGAVEKFLSDVGESLKTVAEGLKAFLDHGLANAIKEFMSPFIVAINAAKDVILATIGFLKDLLTGKQPINMTTTGGGDGKGTTNIGVYKESARDPVTALVQGSMELAGKGMDFATSIVKPIIDAAQKNLVEPITKAAGLALAGGGAGSAEPTKPVDATSAIVGELKGIRTVVDTISTKMDKLQTQAAPATKAAVGSTAPPVVNNYYNSSTTFSEMSPFGFSAYQAIGGL